MPEALTWYESPFGMPAVLDLSEPISRTLERIAQQWPQRPAVITRDSAITFDDLWRRATGLAAQLEAVPIHGPVALVQSLGVDAVAAWFACGLAGRPFLLLDAGHPALRLRELMAAAGAQVVICDRGTDDLVAQEAAFHRIHPDGRTGSSAHSSRLAAWDPAAIFPTSGSSGVPKLILYSMAALQAKVQASIRTFRIPPEARVTIASNHGNFGFLHHALAFLLSGGSVCLVDLHSEGFAGLAHAIDHHGVRHIRFVPSVFRSLAHHPETQAALRQLHGVRFSGETLLTSDLNLAESLLSPDCLIQNVYGSTESGLFIWSRGEPRDPDATSVPIGRVYPLWRYALRTMADTDDAPHERQVTSGELLIRSAYHPLGDLTTAGVTTARFQPVHDESGECLYETGDIVCRGPDGSLRLLGRADRMVKVRGQRVFLAEVERHLQEMPGVVNAAAIAVGSHGRMAIHGFLQANGASLPSGPREWLGHHLPTFMLPQTITVIPEIPLLAGGKVDYQALEAQVPGLGTALPWTSHAEGEHDLQRLYECWREVLGKDGADATRDFFSLGGDSLTLVELSAAIEREFQRSIPVDRFLGDPTITGLARLLGIPVEPSGREAIITDSSQSADEEGQPIAIAEEPIAARASGMRIRRVRQASTPKAGIALAMPGYGGDAQALAFMGAGYFADHDVWTCDVPLERGTILDGETWVSSAIAIADRIRSGALPVPRVLFGFSIAGSIAWLVGRLLSGSRWCPSLIVMIDATPMHRIRAYRTPRLARALAASAPDGLPISFHLHRQRIDGLGVEVGRAALWEPTDRVQVALAIPTVSHGDMMRPEILRSATPVIEALLAGHPHESLFQAPTRVDSLGGRVHALLSERNQGTWDAVAAEMLEMAGREPIGIDPLILLFVGLRHASRDTTASLLSSVIKQSAGSPTLRYALIRLRRAPHLLCPEPLELVRESRLHRIVQVEGVLTSRSGAAERRSPLSLRRTLQGIDLLRAIISAAPTRLQSRFRPR